MAALQWEIRRHQAAIAGRVIDAETGKAMPGARVTATAGPLSWESHSGADGHFHFLDLVDGTYGLTASYPPGGSRYGSAQVEAVVGRDGTGRIQLATADLSLPATRVRGRITRPGGQGVVMAEVVVEGSGERTYSAADGHYALIGVEVGVRRVRVAARGFQPVTGVVTLAAAGAVATLNLTLTPV
ncbi:carboxypeptidase-like regulatory domain-containing protein [Trichloromonas acetexigens]|uniref:Carboxypeptidase regulatory-like domain-containing protein n=1 Tax=Trichloromonas acetexigens TaxID=38815 RepID=A0A550JHI9_9BACT|nr:carboxypeptidase-like regulatory domain-containing protein [Desulfuromonas acetexigens]TRO82670.1 carboxypeptidase regulatory-like domain-containing protein [Desulfuromonas acetexigens]